jgi:hypothetical protein
MKRNDVAVPGISPRGESKIIYWLLIETTHQQLNVQHIQLANAHKNLEVLFRISTHHAISIPT